MGELGFAELSCECLHLKAPQPGVLFADAGPSCRCTITTSETENCSILLHVRQFLPHLVPYKALPDTQFDILPLAQSQISYLQTEHN